MPASLSLGFKMVWRNKRRFLVVMSGTILAVSIIASVFLVGNFQGHEQGVSIIGQYQPPISINSNTNTMNISQYEQLDGIVKEADALGTNIVQNVTHDIVMNSVYGGGYYPSTVIYFVVKNSTINWTTFQFDSSTYENVIYEISDGFNNTPANTILSGTYPVNPKEIMMSSTLASNLSISVGDIVTIGNNATKKLETGFKVVGLTIEPTGNYYPTGYIYMMYDDFRTLINSTTNNGTVSLASSYPLTVYVNLDSVNIFNLNDFIAKISTLATRISIALSNENLNFTVYNAVESDMPSGISLVITFYIISYLALLVVLLLPVIILSTYVSQTIGLEMFEKRTVEFGQFRSRGFSRGQMNKVLMSEILVSTVFCAALSSGIGIGLSYLFIPIISMLSGFFGSSSSSVSYLPFINLGTLIAFAVIVIVLSFLLVLSVYVQPMQLSYTREMIDSLKEKLKAKRRQNGIIVGIVFMYLLGCLPLVFYVIFESVMSNPAVSTMLAGTGGLVSILAMFSPFFLAFATIKLLGEKRPKQFGKLCTIFLKKSKMQLKHVITRNISAKSAKIAKLMLIIAFTISFALTVRISSQSLVNYQAQQNQLLIGSDVVAYDTGNLGNLSSFRDSVSSKANVTSSTCAVESPGDITNLNNQIFTFYSFDFFMVDMQSFINTSRVTNNKYLLDTSWKALAIASNQHQPIALLPSDLKPYVQGSMIDVQISESNASGNFTMLTKQFTIAGYFKAFPTIGAAVNSYAYYGVNNVILNVNPWQFLAANYTENFPMVVSIRTPYTNQASIDDAAAGMNLSNYITASNLTSSSSTVAFSPLVENPVFYGLLDADYWLVLAISVFGIGTITFMKITSERKEIGLFRIRGFDNRQIYNMQLSEKYMPVLIAAIFGTIAGFVSAILVTTNVALDFAVYNPLINYPIDVIFTWQDALTLLILPILLYLVIILLAIKNELRQNLGSIMDEED